MKTQEFFQAVKEGVVQRVEGLLKQEPELTVQKVEGASALHIAAGENHLTVVDLLLAHGADINVLDDEFGMTPIAWANEKGHKEMVHHLYRKGAVLDLNRAAATGQVDRVKELLALKPWRVNTVIGYGAPIHEASLWGRPEIVELLLKHGANPRAINCFGQTALEIARKQIDSGCKATPIASAPRKAEILTGCKQVIDLLQRHGVNR